MYRKIPSYCGADTHPIAIQGRFTLPSSIIDLVPEIRNAVRALIVREEQILLLRKEGGGRGVRYALPGGAQDLGETLHDALNRECREEIATDVTIGELLHVADFFKRRDTDPPSRRHVVEFLFRCTVPADYVPRNGHHPDKHQVAVIWAPLSEVARMQLFPAFLTSCIAGIDGEVSPARYLGRCEDHADT